jgi:PA-IL-like protein
MSDCQRSPRPRFGTRFARLIILGAVVLAAAGTTTVASASSTAPSVSPLYTITVQANDASLTNTGIVVAAGEKVVITASGKVAYNSRGDKITAAGKPVPSETCATGVSAGWFNANLNCLSLIGRFGSGEVFQVGDSTKIHDVEGGRLYLIFNDNDYVDNSGQFTVKVTVS